MKTRVPAVVIIFISSFLFGELAAYSGQEVKKAPSGGKGYLEIECNYAGVDLYACPLDQYERKTIRMFFGLFTTDQEICTGEKLFLGITPLEPVELVEGRYVLFIPVNYVWEHEGRIEVSVTEQQKTFFLLKLFEPYPTHGRGDADGGGSGIGGGSGTGGAPGTGPP